MLFTDATFVLLDLYVTVPSVVLVRVFVKAASVVFFVTELPANASFASALLIVKVTDFSPLYFPAPVTFAVAVPAFVLSE